jgi:catechol 2,3-dioxygenase-like lactoylglutathione lyase family enzyme
MLDHTGITVTDIARSRAFYQAALAPLGYVISRDFGEAVGFGVPDGFGRSPDPGGDFWVGKGEPSVPRQHIAFTAASRTTVDAAHAAALAAGGKDNGPPGLRPHYHPTYYAAFILDPDGYNFEFVCHTEA